MSNDSESKMEIELDENENDDEIKYISDENLNKSTPSTPNCEKKSNGKSNHSAEKLDKNLKLQVKIENAKKRQEEKEKREKEKKEREEARLKREEEIKKKKEEEERIKQKKLEEKEREKERKAAEQAEKERLRLETLKKREEEKKMKEEERKQKEEERRKKEEEKQREEEEKKQKEEKIKNQFISFFIKKENPSNEKNDEIKNLRFMPFQLKENMTVAPNIRRTDFVYMNDEEKNEFFRKLDKILDHGDNLKIFNYIKEIRENPNLIRKREIHSRRQHHGYNCSSNSDVKEINIDPEPAETKFRIKYLHFNPKVYKRPPYFGTWRKKSKIIGPRRPFAKDEKHFDYDFDSDDEWEEEPDGESICDSEKDDDEETIDEDDDDGFFVPHGHLSDDELDEEEITLDPEIKKAREENKREEWELERRKGSKILIPKGFIVPDFWKRENTFEEDSKIVYQMKMFERLKCILLNTNIPINTFDPIQKSEESKSTKGTKLEASPSAAKSKSQKSRQQSNSQSPMPSQSQNHVQASPTTTASIIKFISKMSKKDVICKLEPINGSNQNTTVPVSPVPCKKPNNFATPVTPNSPKMTTTGSTAEKRVCSGNGESAVKRLKLDENQSISNELKTPSTPNSIISMFKKSESCKKSLKMTHLSDDSESSKMETEGTDVTKKDNKENSISIITLD